MKKEYEELKAKAIAAANESVEPRSWDGKFTVGIDYPDGSSTYFRTEITNAELIKSTSPAVILAMLSEIAKVERMGQLIRDLRNNLYYAKRGRRKAEHELNALHRANNEVFARWRAKIDQLEREVKALESFKRSVEEALNSGDGSYRP